MGNAITPQPAQPPVQGVFAALPIINDGQRWEGGIEYAPDTCGQGGGLSRLDCIGRIVGARTGGSSPNTEEAEPFLIYYTDECSTFGFESHDYEGRAQRGLEAVQSFHLASEMWDGAETSAGSLPNRVLTDTDSDTVTGAASNITSALACLEQGLAVHNLGRRGLVHMTPQLLVHAVGANLLTKQGAFWYTPMGNLVVADAGYSGTGPGLVDGDTTQWMFGTSMIRLRVAPIEVPFTFAEQFDRATNTVVFYAQRVALWEWDGCAHVAAQVDIPVCELNGGS